MVNGKLKKWRVESGELRVFSFNSLFFAQIFPKNSQFSILNSQFFTIFVPKSVTIYLLTDKLNKLNNYDLFTRSAADVLR